MQLKLKSNPRYGVDLEKYRCANVSLKIFIRLKDDTTFSNVSTARPSGHSYSQMNVSWHGDNRAEDRDCSVADLINFEKDMLSLLGTYSDSDLAYAEVTVSCLDNAHRRTTMGATSDQPTVAMIKDAYKQAALIRKQYIVYAPRNGEGPERLW